MPDSKIQVDVNDLQIGMYVCELDIPWLESPFLFQGFPLNSNEEIDNVKQVCGFVFVDPEKSSSTLRTHLQKLATVVHAPRETSHVANKRTVAQGTSYNFREHLQLARRIYKNTRSYVNDTYDKVRSRDAVNVRAAKTLVREMTDNIIVNPNAMMWLTHLKERHEYTLTHSINVCILALIFGRHLKLHKTELELLGLGALLHDIGKLRIPTEILDKPGKLTEEEYEVMKTHPVEGYRILKSDSQMPIEALEIVLHHHERNNGKGYPSQFNRQQIKKLIKLAAIVDVYDAITSDRCYHDGMSPYRALQNIYKWTDGHFEKEFVEEFMSCMGLYPVGTIVLLNDGHIGIVIATTAKTRLRPTVLLVQGADQKFLNQRRVYNLSSQEWDQKDKRLEISHVIEPKESNINVRQILEEESLSPEADPSMIMEGMGSLLS